jgi:hypothetical protein
MKEIIEVREIEDDKIKDILYFEYEPDADEYIESSKSKCIKKSFPIITKGRKVDNFKKERLKEQALNKLTSEEKEILGLI